MDLPRLRRDSRAMLMAENQTNDGGCAFPQPIHASEGRWLVSGGDQE